MRVREGAKGRFEHPTSLGENELDPLGYQLPWIASCSSENVMSKEKARTNQEGGMILLY